MTQLVSPERIHVIVVTYNRPTELAASLQALGRQTVCPHSLTIVNNGRDLGPAEPLLELSGISRGEVLDLENVGPAGGFNSGIRSISRHGRPEDLVLLLDDNDPLPGPHVIEDLLRATVAVREDARFAAVGLGGARFDRQQIRVRRPTVQTGLTPVDHLWGGWAPLYSLAWLEKVGGFRGPLFWGFEELDLGLRIVESGGLIYAALGLRAEYTPPRPRPSQLTLTQTPIRRYYSIRNMIDIASARSPRTRLAIDSIARGILKPLANIPRNPRLAAEHAYWGGLAVIDGYRGRLGIRQPPSSGDATDRRADLLGAPARHGPT